MENSNEKKQLIKDKVLTLLFIFTLTFFIISFSIAMPIYFRPFYFWQIKPLNLEAISGRSYDEIVQAYNEVLDFCCGFTNEFSAGVMAFSEEGASHFADCQILFLLDSWVLVATVIANIIMLVLIKFNIFRPYRFLKRGPLFWASLLAVLIPLVVFVGVLIVGFDEAFRLFHQLFFPGKDNWLFDPRFDEVILVLPEQYFMNCAIFIGVVFAIVCAAFISIDIIKGKKLLQK